MMLVGVDGRRIGRGDDGAKLGGVIVGDSAATARASGLQESLR